MRLRRRDIPPEDFQMAPMIDMVFLLIVFFMCVSTLAQAEKSVPVDLPESIESKVPEDLSDRAIVTIQSDGGIFVGSERMTLAEAGGHVKEALARRPDLRLLVRADRDVSFAEIRKVLRACAEAGAYEIVYATHQAE